MLSVPQKEMVQITTALKSAGTKDREGGGHVETLVVCRYKRLYIRDSTNSLAWYIHNSIIGSGPWKSLFAQTHPASKIARSDTQEVFQDSQDYPTDHFHNQGENNGRFLAKLTKSSPKGSAADWGFLRMRSCVLLGWWSSSFVSKVICELALRSASVHTSRGSWWNGIPSAVIRTVGGCRWDKVEDLVIFSIRSLRFIQKIAWIVPWLDSLQIKVTG